MIRRLISRNPPFDLTAAMKLSAPLRHLATQHAPPSRVTELERVDSVVNGADYRHWLVMMDPPENYPQRAEIVQQYITTLSMALGSEEAAKRCIYSVSTKYYYAFGCKVPENVTQKIKSLPRVRWVLPDSYLPPEENGYGGELCIDGNAAPYDEKVHSHWLRNEHGDDCKEGTGSRHRRRRRRKGINGSCEKSS